MIEYDTVCATDLVDTLLYTTTGNGLTMMSNRLSWFYDLRGPSLTLDTACSSSLVALSLAVQQIRNSNSENRQAIVAGSNLILVPDYTRRVANRCEKVSIGAGRRGTEKAGFGDSRLRLL